MKKYLVLALAAIALTACKKNDEPVTPPIEEGDLLLTTQASTKALLPDYVGNSNNFFALDDLGFFMAVTGTMDPATTVVPDTYKFWDATTVANAANYGYVYGTPYWSPLKPDTEKLKYQKDKGVQLFAYFPYQSSTNTVVGNPIKFPATLDATTEPNLEFQIADNQTDPKILRMADLMWTKNTNSDKGFTISSKPINMTFNHLMARTNFGVKVYNTQIGAGATEAYTLRAVIANGNEINTQVAKFNIVSGVMTPTAVPNDAYNSKVYYFDNTVAPAFNATVTDANKVVGNAVPFKTAATPAVERLDLLLYPFTQSLTKNKFFFILSDGTVEYDVTKTNFLLKYPTLAELEAGVLRGDKGLYMYSYEIKTRTENSAAEGQPNNGAWIFDAGVNNILNVTIDVSSKAIDIITTIKPWTDLPAVEVPAE